MGGSWSFIQNSNSRFKDRVRKFIPWKWNCVQWSSSFVGKPFDGKRDQPSIHKWINYQIKSDLMMISMFNW